MNEQDMQTLMEEGQFKDRIPARRALEMAFRKGSDALRKSLVELFLMKQKESQKAADTYRLGIFAHAGAIEAVNAWAGAAQLTSEFSLAELPVVLPVVWWGESGRRIGWWISKNANDRRPRGFKPPTMQPTRSSPRSPRTQDSPRFALNGPRRCPKCHLGAITALPASG